MSAHADDLRTFYAEHIGESVLVPVTVAPTPLAEKLPPGRYLLHTRTVAGASTLWIRQGAYGEVQEATDDAPSTPLDLAESPRPRMTFMVRPAGRGNAAASSKATDGFSFRTNAGTVTVVLTRISRPE